MSASGIIAGAAFLIPTIASIFGIKDPTQLTEELYAQLVSIVNSTYSKWVDKASQAIAGGSLSASQIGKPDFNWLKKQLYEQQAQQTYDFSKALNQAKIKDNESFGNSIWGKGLKVVGNALVDATKLGSNIPSMPGGWMDRAKESISRWGNDNQDRVISHYESKNKQAADAIKKIEKKQVVSHNSNKLNLKDYRNVTIKKG